MSKPSIQVFKPFSVDGCSDQFHHKIQEIIYYVIYYGESRSWHMAAKFFQADTQHRAWMQDALQEEVVSSCMHKMLSTSLLV
jgi:hypothetical protein